MREAHIHRVALFNRSQVQGRIQFEGAGGEAAMHQSGMPAKGEASQVRALEHLPRGNDAPAVAVAIRRTHGLFRKNQRGEM